MNVIVLAENYEKYVSGNYHNDLINAMDQMFDLFKYGPGYDNYNHEDTIEDVIKKSGMAEIDMIVVATSWENQNAQEYDSDPHPRICLAGLCSIKKVFFLNKEYKKLPQKLEYIKRNQFDLVVTVLAREKYDEWMKLTGVRFIQSHFGIDLNVFKPCGLNRKYDFSFTGALHNNFIDERTQVKKEIFNDDVKSNRGLPRLANFKNPIKQEYRKYNIYWAEWGKTSIDCLGRSLLPTGKRYVKLMNQSKCFLCTKSAEGIFGTRFFELMACKTLIICPEGDYYGILTDKENCLMYKSDMSNFSNVLKMAVEDEDLRRKLTDKAYKFSLNQSYINRLNDILKILGFNSISK